MTVVQRLPLIRRQWDLTEHMTWHQKTWIHFATPNEIVDLGNDN